MTPITADFDVEKLTSVSPAYAQAPFLGENGVNAKKGGNLIKDDR
jgi:hypothetical protein